MSAVENEPLLRDSILALSPHNVAAYLHSHHWKVSEKREGWSAFAYQGEGRYDGAEIVLPLTKSYSDFGMRMSEALETLATVEERNLATLLEDLFSIDADTCRFRWVAAGLPPGEIPLIGAARLLDGVREMLSAAAFTAVRPRPFYASGRPPVEVSRFLREARVSAAHAGSYVVTVKAPIVPSIVQRTLWRDDAEETADAPFSRRVMTRLASGLQSLQSLLSDAASLDELPNLLSYVEKGLNANLCDAVTGMLDEGAQRLETIISWSPLKPLRHPPAPRIVIQQESRQWISAVSTALKEDAVAEDYELQGLVVTLHRIPHGRKPAVGDVWVLAMVEGKTVQVLAEHVAEEDYTSFVLAHKEKRAVFCRGELVRHGRQYTLKNIRDVRVFERSG